jgi:glucose-6-phosphate isomerase
MLPRVMAAHELIHNGQGQGADQLGWRDWPVDYDRDELERVKAAAKQIQDQAEILLVIGVGGSYIGARSVIELLKGQDYNFTAPRTPQIFYVGNNLSATKLKSVLQMCEGRELAINVISKSGTTLEPALAFRILRAKLIEKYGEAARQRIYVTTNPGGGALKDLADREGYQTFRVPDDIAGRFSVLTAVGLLPIATAGVDIDALLNGAAAARADTMEADPMQNQANRYAAIRNILYEKGYTNEMLVSYESAFSKMAEWWKQLYSESEGKNHGGILPMTATYTTDLHSMGQYLQDGRRDLIETVINFETATDKIIIKAEPGDTDGLNFLAGKTMDEVNHAAMTGTLMAHVESGVPNILINIPKIEEFEVGYMLYFFEKSCAISGYISGINPFNQPGVEAYKQKMYELLDKPG